MNFIYLIRKRFGEPLPPSSVQYVLKSDKINENFYYSIYKSAYIYIFFVFLFDFLIVERKDKTIILDDFNYLFSSSVPLLENQKEKQKNL